MCKCVLPPGVNPIAVYKYININININMFVLDTGAASLMLIFGVFTLGAQ
jgi:hypothetical protein